MPRDLRPVQRLGIGKKHWLHLGEIFGKYLRVLRRWGQAQAGRLGAFVMSFGVAEIDALPVGDCFEHRDVITRFSPGRLIEAHHIVIMARNARL